MYTVRECTKAINNITELEDFYDNVREIIGYNKGIFWEDHQIKSLQRKADAQYNKLLGHRLFNLLDTYEVNDDETTVEDCVHAISEDSIDVVRYLHLLYTDLTGDKTGIFDIYELIKLCEKGGGDDA